MERLEDRHLLTGMPELLADAAPGPDDSHPREFTLSGDVTYFAANEYELWKTDGTSAGTVLLRDVGEQIGYTYIRELFDLDGTLAFLRTHRDEFFDFEGGDLQLWRSDGTTDGTVLVKDFGEGTAISDGAYFTELNGVLFGALDDTVSGVELWRSDLTFEGTELVKDINPGAEGPYSSFPADLINFEGTLYFSADDGVNGRELWKSDGTEQGTVLLKDILPGTYDQLACYGMLYGYPRSSSPTDLTVVGDHFFFGAHDPGTSGDPCFDSDNGVSWWKSDGTTDGTVLVKDFGPGSYFSYPQLTNVNGTLFGMVSTPESGGELWKSDGTEEGTVLVKDIWPGDSSWPVGLTAVNGLLFFSADDGVNGRELWKSDGTSAGTVLVKDIFPGEGTSDPFDLTHAGGVLYFRANDGVHGAELWRSDGTEEGTVLVADLEDGLPGSYPERLTHINGRLLFSASAQEFGFEPWVVNLLTNNPPTAFAQTVITDEDVDVFIQLTADDGNPEVDQELTFAIVSPPANGTLVDFDPATGQLTYQPDPDFNGSDSFQFTVTDDDQAGPPANLTSNPATVSILVEPVNKPPVALPQDLTTDEDVALEIFLTAADGDPEVNQELTFAITQVPANGTILEFDSASGRVVYQPDPDFNGPDSFQFTATDDDQAGPPANLTSDPATVSIFVEPVNKPPVALPQTLTTGQSQPVQATLTGLDGDPEVDQVLTFRIVTLPSNGTIVGFDSSTGQLTYHPDPGFSGSDSFQFTVTDDEQAGLPAFLESDPATVTINITPIASTVSSLVGRASKARPQGVERSGQWWLAQSTGSSFESALWGTWSTAVTWVDVMQADVNNNGLQDIVGRNQATGDWWVALNTPSGFENQKWGRWSTHVDWVDVMVADVDGDGNQDIVGRVAETGDWWVAKSDGTQFENQKWGRWSTHVDWVDVMVADVDGDGRQDLVGRVAQSGHWWVARSDGEQFDNQRWGRWSPHVNWVDVMVGDFDGDGRDDIVGRVGHSGVWWLARSGGEQFHNERWGRWSAGVEWVDVMVGDFDGDGRTDLVGRAKQSGAWWVARSDGEQFHNEQWGQWSTAVRWVSVSVGDFNGDGLDDLVGRAAQTGEWWVGLSLESGFSNEQWGRWSTTVIWADVLLTEEFVESSLPG